MKKLSLLVVGALTIGLSAIAAPPQAKPVERERTELIAKLKEAKLLVDRSAEALIERGLSIAHVREISRLADRIATVKEALKGKTVEVEPGVQGAPLVGRGNALGMVDFHMERVVKSLIRMGAKVQDADIIQLGERLAANYKEAAEAGDISMATTIANAFDKADAKLNAIITAKSKAAKNATLTAEERNLANPKVKADIDEALFRVGLDMAKERNNGRVNLQDAKFIEMLRDLVKCLRGRELAA